MNHAHYHDETRSYLDLLRTAFTTSQETFRFPTPPKVNSEWEISDEDIRNLRGDLNMNWFPIVGPSLGEERGNSCQILAASIATYLTVCHGIDAEIIIGDVSINGGLEYDTEMETLKNEYFSSTPLTGSQTLHAWVTVGGDTIIDAALTARLFRYYKMKDDSLPPVMVGRDAQFMNSGAGFTAKYIPMIYGSDFLEKTTPHGPSVFREFYEKVKREYME